MKAPGTGKPLLLGAGMSTPGAPFSTEDRVRHLILPVIMLAAVSAAGYMRSSIYPMLMALLMINTVLIVFSNLLADVGYAVLFPRIRYD